MMGAFSLFFVLVAFVWSIEAAAPAGYSFTPAGLVPSSCVHTVPHGSAVHHDASGRMIVTAPDGTQKRIPRCPVKPLASPDQISQKGKKNAKKSAKRSAKQSRQFSPDYDGWLGYTTYSVPTTFDSFLGSFSVPQEPANDPDVLYVFTGESCTRHARELRN